MYRCIVHIINHCMLYFAFYNRRTISLYAFKYRKLSRLSWLPVPTFVIPPMGTFRWFFIDGEKWQSTTHIWFRWCIHCRWQWQFKTKIQISFLFTCKSLGYTWTHAHCWHIYFPHWQDPYPFIAFDHNVLVVLFLSFCFYIIFPSLALFNMQNALKLWLQWLQRRKTLLLLLVCDV